MDDLVTWLRAQLDEDQEAAVVAAALTRSPWTSAASAITCGDGFTLAQVEDGEPATAEHIARHDPGRVLAEVEAKRRILDLHEPVNGYDPNGPVCSACGESGNPGDESAVVRWPCRTVRLLAQPYAGRDGWREEWGTDVR